jgi:hypothetical protein
MMFWGFASNGAPHLTWGNVVAQLVEALCYKPEDGWFGSQWGHWDFSLT